VSTLTLNSRVNERRARPPLYSSDNNPDGDIDDVDVAANLDAHRRGD